MGCSGPLYSAGMVNVAQEVMVIGGHRATCREPCPKPNASDHLPLPNFG